MQAALSAKSEPDEAPVEVFVAKDYQPLSLQTLSHQVVLGFFDWFNEFGCDFVTLLTLYFHLFPS